ncbi:uncharacterized protein LOC121244049 [Juglans microcarpa x Juglans regia]|uniref:uncharacterized protein LOC121244049 n=1 Tax=Juglans microcarpa x Juglans regia TaxID=2249226 RepID=UPI001B7F22D9|nr:uncharacterized protein LOC121244049 [Juglans microcarpa x Juglans regia]
MRTNLLVLSLLLILSLLLSEAQGIRLDKKFMSHWQRKVHEDHGSALVEKTNGGVGEVILCKDGHCISGKNRKLITTTSTSPSTTIPTSKNEMNEENKADPMSKGEPGNGKDHGEEENLVVNHGKTGSTSDQHQEFAHSEHFPADIIDMAELDYSPARRKPPIHN